MTGQRIRILKSKSFVNTPWCTLCIPIQAHEESEVVGTSSASIIQDRKQRRIYTIVEISVSRPILGRTLSRPERL